MNFKIPKNYGLVLIISTAIGLECYATGFLISQNSRRKHFNKKYLEENFKEQHEKAFKNKLPSLGYPDMGNGYFSSKLSYKNWFEFNSAKRAHENFVEQLGFIIPNILIGGLIFPKTAIGFGLTYFMARVAYAIGYTSIGGPNNREFGAYILNITCILSFGLSFMSGIKIQKIL